jgi:hypothetical protein
MLLDRYGKPLTDPLQSDLIRQPIVGGKAHAGIHLFNPGDPEDVTFADWLKGKTLASCSTSN